MSLSASRGVAICELSFTTSEPDYTLFVDRKAIGTVEAKPKRNDNISAQTDSAVSARFDRLSAATTSK